MLEFLEKKETKIVAITISIILLIILVMVLFNQNNLKQTKNSLEHEAGQELVFDAKDYFDVDEETAEAIAFDTSKVNANKVGEYEATATYKNKSYSIQVKVVDTTAPKVDFACRYVFTNDAANTDFTEVFESVTDASECTAKLIRYEYSENLSVMGEKALKSLTDKINTAAKDDELKNLGIADVPTVPGIYHGVVEIMDEHGNATYEEVYVILDQTGAKIEDVEDKTITVSSENLSTEPVVDKSEYKITDNVDGKIAADDIICELELRDEAKHEWIVHVSYTDRAGNKSKADFLIIVKEGETESTQTGNDGTSNNGGATSNQGSNIGNSGSSNQGSNSNTGNNTNMETDNKPTNNQDVSTWVPTDDEDDISPSEQKVIDAGYGNVVKFDTGNYGVLMKNSEHTINGKGGFEILDEYLASLDLCSTNMSGGWIDEDNGWYMFIAKDVHELITSDEEEFWD